jgi:hypothetical protein
MELKRRVKLVAIDIGDIVGLFNAASERFDCMSVPVLDEVPEGYSVSDATYDFAAHAIVLKVHHESFPEVAPGCHIPYLVTPTASRKVSYFRPPEPAHA